MYFWLKFLHVAAMAVWLGGLLLLPRLLPRRQGAREEGGWEATGRMLYFNLMTPGAVLTIVFGTALLAWGFEGAWLPAKLALVAMAVLLHVYFGMRLVEVSKGRSSGLGRPQRIMGWAPLLLVLLIAALAAGKPRALPPLGGI